MKVEGVALGTLIAQYAGLFMAFALWLKYYGRLKAYIDWNGLWGGEEMRRFFSVNSDIFFRTLCLVAVTTFFTSTGARQGDVILAVNTLLMQLFTLFSYIMDGFAYAGEALAGRFIGAKNDVGLRRCIRLLFLWGIGLSLSFTILYAFLGRDFLGLLTNDTSVIEASGGLFLLGIGDPFMWILRFPLGRYLYRGHGYTPDALLDACGLGYFLYYLLPVLSIDGKSCVMDGFPWISLLARWYAMDTLAI